MGGPLTACGSATDIDDEQGRTGGPSHPPGGDEPPSPGGADGGQNLGERSLTVDRVTSQDAVSATPGRWRVSPPDAGPSTSPITSITMKPTRSRWTSAVISNRGRW